MLQTSPTQPLADPEALACGARKSSLKGRRARISTAFTPGLGFCSSWSNMEKGFLGVFYPPAPLSSGHFLLISEAALLLRTNFSLHPWLMCSETLSLVFHPHLSEGAQAYKTSSFPLPKSMSSLLLSPRGSPTSPLISHHLFFSAFKEIFDLAELA